MPRADVALAWVIIEVTLDAVLVFEVEEARHVWEEAIGTQSAHEEEGEGNKRRGQKGGGGDRREGG
jgi:hypothetical protein